MLRRLHHTQPDAFTFTPANLAWAQGQITKYPEGRQASAVIPLLWRAQEQEGWISQPALEFVADTLSMDYIRVLEVASFYFMFQLQPVGSVAHIQVCGTTSCMICGAEDLMAVCQQKIAAKPHDLSADGRFSWEEVECLGSCSNAPMAQIGKDYYEDLTTKRFGEILDELAAGKVPIPGPQNGRYAAEPVKGLTSLTEYDSGRTQYNASVQAAMDIGDTIKRIDGTEVPLVMPWQNKGATPIKAKATKPRKPKAAKPAEPKAKAAASSGQPKGLDVARTGGADDLKMIRGIGPKLEKLLNSMGYFHFDQIADWRATDVAWVDENLKGFKGRVSRDNWVDQAKPLADGKETAFSKKAKKDGKYKK